ncbi:GtrA family protein [Pedobacter sp. GR22-10]|uniref:GtrA family protein n=1 Tax=Pedobacter sp. GR22-10 TaxID=2994472 RepID=UPI0022458EF0|nr:GtrA family protein [Pedobacter sp. GR22-10]MCX2430147.1 GtrA family protein [Pedobacter sp. GR22-10]
MLRFFKAQASSLMASASDFLVTLAAVKLFGLWYLAGSITGTITGGVINFYINRNWVFQAHAKALRWQVVKYIIVWTGNLALLTSGVYLLTHFYHLNYMLSKLLVSVTVGISYNYIMQKQFIFSVK